MSILVLLDKFGPGHSKLLMRHFCFGDLNKMLNKTLEDGVFMENNTHNYMGCIALEVHYLKKWYFFCNFDGL